MKIFPTQEQFETIFSGRDTRYKIPFNQRSYKWKHNESAEEYFLDIFKAWKDGEDSYFIGPYVLLQKDSNIREYEIIDGQQRFVATTILLSVIRKIAKTYQVNPEYVLFSNIEIDERESANEIMEKNYLRDRSTRPHFLELSDKDKKNFKSYVQDEDNIEIDSLKRTIRTNDPLILKSRNHFYSLIKENFFGDSENFRGLKKLCEFWVYLTDKVQLLQLTFEDEGDAYALFEGLNARGLDLTQSELLKNHVLRLCAGDDIKIRRVLDHWEQMTDLIKTSKYSLVEYIRIYWSAIYKKTTLKNLYKEIKRGINKDNVENIIDKLSQGATVFSDLTSIIEFPSTEYGDSKLLKIMAEMNAMNYRLALPCIFYLNFEKNEYDDNEIEKFCETVKNFLFRYITIGGLRVGKAESRMDSALESLKKNNSMPDILKNISRDIIEIRDDDFKSKFRQYIIGSNDIGKYILSKIEENVAGDTLVINRQKVNLEHIFPQNNSDLDLYQHEDHQDSVEPESSERSVHIQSIGNLAILLGSTNRSIGNKPPSEKVEAYTSSQISTTNKITSEELEKWSVASIKKRAGYLSKYACEVWPL